MKKKIDKPDFIKTKNFCSMKDTVKRVRRQSTDWEKILTKHTPDKGLLLKIYKDILIFNNVENN